MDKGNINKEEKIDTELVIIEGIFNKIKDYMISKPSYYEKIYKLVRGEILIKLTKIYNNSIYERIFINIYKTRNYYISVKIKINDNAIYNNEIFTNFNNISENINDIYNIIETFL